MGEGSSLGEGYELCFPLLQTSTEFPVSALVWCGQCQGEGSGFARWHLCIHHPGEAHPKELGMAKVPRRCCSRLAQPRAVAPCPAPMLIPG